MTAKLAVLALSMLLGACGSREDSASTPQSAAAADEATAGNDPSAKLARSPEDPCTWLTREQVVATVGELAAEPVSRNGCRYTLVIPQAAQARRDRVIAQQQQMSKAVGGDDPWARAGGAMANYERDPTNYALTLDVLTQVRIEAEMGVEAAAAQLGDGASAKEDAAAAVKSPWDVVYPIPYGFSGRSGHLQVTAQADAPDVPKELAQALALAALENIPELPFASTGGQRMLMSGAVKDPCALLTREEAESVLGALKVDPYRTSSQQPALAHAQGHACAWFTAGHRVFSLLPIKEGGREAFELDASASKFMAAVMPEEALTIKGPWDDARLSPQGFLLLLQGDRVLEVHFRTSSVGLPEAVKLAAMAMPRLQQQ